MKEINDRSNNLRIYYIEIAKRIGVEKYNYKLFAKDLGLPYTSVKTYLNGGNIRSDSICRKIERTLNKPYKDMDEPRDKVKWPLEFGYWNHPVHHKPKAYTDIEENTLMQVAEEESISTEEKLQLLRTHLLSAFTLNELDKDPIISRFARFGELS